VHADVSRWSEQESCSRTHTKEQVYPPASRSSKLGEGMAALQDWVLILDTTDSSREALAHCRA
jgi:hypothetical protein